MSTVEKTAEEYKRDLDVQFVGGLAWTAGAKWATQFITWASVLALVRILSPADFGLAGMVGLYTNLTNVLAEFGIGSAVLHMPDLNRKALGQLNAFSCLLSCALFSVAAMATPLVAAFFRTDQYLLFNVNNIAFLITGVQAVPMGLLQRDMDYRKLSIVDASMVLVQSVVSVVTACMGWGAWSLVAGCVVGKATAAALVCYWKSVPVYWPRWEEIRTPVAMGKQLAIGRVAWSAYSQADALAIGRMLGDAALGTYQQAMNLASAPAEKISTLIMRIASPLFANVMDDCSLVRRYYLIMVETLSIVVMPLMIGLAVVAPDAVPIVLGHKWLAAAMPLRWLALFMLIRAMGTLTEQVLISQRMSRFTMRMSIFNVVVMPLSFIAAAHWMGAPGVAAAWLILSPITVLPLIVVLLRRIRLPSRDFAAVLLPGVAGSAVMCVVLFAIRNSRQFAAAGAGLRLSVLVIAGAAVYSAVVLGCFRGTVWRYVRFLRSLQKGREL